MVIHVAACTHLQERQRSEELLEQVEAAKAKHVADAERADRLQQQVGCAWGVVGLGGPASQDDL